MKHCDIEPFYLKVNQLGAYLLNDGTYFCIPENIDYLLSLNWLQILFCPVYCLVEGCQKCNPIQIFCRLFRQEALFGEFPLY